MQNSLFLKALSCKNYDKRPPVWLMRQAGRYMPSYQKIKQSYSLDQMFRQEDLITEVTLLPVNELDIDAAIIFSDILLILEVFGFDVSYPINQGPSISPKVKELTDVTRFQKIGSYQSLEPVLKAMSSLKKQLKIPLIGFVGGPFSVLSYAIEDEHKSDLRKTKRWIYSEPSSMHKMLQALTDATIHYLNLQIQAGADVVQIFDSWAGVLPEREFRIFALPYLKQITQALKDTHIPVIVFTRGSCFYLEDLIELNPHAISVDWMKPLHEMIKKIPAHIAVQGNLDPDLLFASPSYIKEKTKELLHAMKGHPGFIMNLGHGILPGTPFDHVKLMVDTVKEYTA